MNHPNLITNFEELKRAKEWIKKHEWYRLLFEQRKAEIDRFIAHGPVYVSPIKQEYQYKMYECPNHEVGLIYDEFSPFEHKCPKDESEIFSGGKYDSAWAGWYNGKLANYIYWMGLLYHVYGEEKYAKAGKEILLGFSDLYLKYPTENTILGPAHVFFGTLSESFWGVFMAYGYDLLYDYDGFTEENRKNIKEKLFYPLAEITQKFPESASNRQLWYNNVSAAVGFLYDDKNLLDFAFKGEYGFEWQLGSALPESGFWGEGPGYHFVTLHGMIHLAEMSKHHGIDLYNMEISGRTIKKMFDAPLELIKPNYEFPRFKDSGGGNILEYAPYYEVGFAVYNDEKYLKLLNISQLNRGSQVVDIDSGLGEKKEPVSLFNLIPVLPEMKGDIYPLASSNLAGNGIAVLRNGRDEKRRCVFLDYGILGGEHGHPDRLQIEYFALGKNWILDPLNESYFNPNLQTWFRQTIAHNTIVINETTQGWANGRYKFFNATDSLQIASGFSDTIYPGAEITRTIIQVEDYFIDICNINCREERIIDLPIHSFGKLNIDNIDMIKKPENYFGDKPGIPGYDQLTNIFSGKTNDEWSGIFDTGDGKFLLVKAIGEKDTEVFKAITPPIGGFYKQMVKDQSPLPMILSRRITNSTSFVYLMHAYENETDILDFSRGAKAGILVIKRKQGEDIIYNGNDSVYWLVRRVKNIPAIVSCFNVSEIEYAGIKYFEAAKKIEKAEFIYSGDILNITITDFIALKILAPGINQINLNGEPAVFSRDGDYVILRQKEKVIIEYISPEDNKLFIGKENILSFRIWNLTDKPLCDNIQVMPDEKFKEIAEKQVKWWGGIVNLRAMNKQSNEKIISPSGYNFNLPEFGKSQNKTIQPYGNEIFKININLPNDIPPVKSGFKFEFMNEIIEKQIEFIHPISASLYMPNNKIDTITLNLKNNTGSDQKLSLEFETSEFISLDRKEIINMVLYSFEEVSINIKYNLTGYNPDNQLYPVILKLKSGEYEIKIKHDFYIGKAYYAKELPSLNGDWDNWIRTNPITIDKQSQVCKLLMGNRTWKGPEDLSAKIYAMYDDNYLYVGAEVTDDIVVTHFDFPKMSYPWDTDSMEIILDTRINSEQGFDPPTPGLFRHLCLAENNPDIFSPEKWQGGSAGGPTLPKPNLIPGAETYFNLTSKGYNMICRIPLKNLKNIRVEKGKKIGFDIAINDNDGTTYRKNQHIWAGFNQNQSWWDMGTIGALIFEE
jgi:hypothetical protein